MIRYALQIVMMLFPASELALLLVKRSRAGSAQREDRGSLGLLWLGIAAGIGLAIAAEWARWAVLPWPLPILRATALALLVGGLAVRWAAILSLGRLFTVDVAIHPDQPVVQRGLYRYVRHPSYSGLLLAFLGLGVAFANWLSLVALTVPITLAVLWRVRKEERALLEALGPAYATYCAHTKRFIPWLL
jgi:protein-S-isoprenylcysteine O-methyltransferase